MHPVCFDQYSWAVRIETTAGAVATSEGPDSNTIASVRPATACTGPSSTTWRRLRATCGKPAAAATGSPSRGVTRLAEPSPTLPTPSAFTATGSV